MRKLILFLMLLTLLIPLSVAAEGQQDNDSLTIVFADLSWDSVQVHNRIVAYIIENGLEGYKADFVPGDSVPTINAITQGDIDVDMESWQQNLREVYDKGIASGNLINLGKNLPDGPQGWWIPRYMVEGPDAVAPGLKSVTDLPRYAHLFTDPEDPSRGVIYGGVAGWGQLTTSEEFFDTYNLHDDFNMGIVGSQAALAASMVGSYKKGEPWIGYYWAPTAVMGKLDMIRLKGSEYPKADVDILVNKSMLDKAPDVVEILKNYSTTVDHCNKFLSEMDDNGWDAAQAAEWFLKNNESVWTEWVSSDAAEKVKAALKG